MRPSERRAELVSRPVMIHSILAMAALDKQPTTLCCHRRRLAGTAAPAAAEEVRGATRPFVHTPTTSAAALLYFSHVSESHCLRLQQAMGLAGALPTTLSSTSGGVSARAVRLRSRRWHPSVNARHREPTSSAQRPVCACPLRRARRARRWDGLRGRLRRRPPQGRRWLRRVQRRRRRRARVREPARWRRRVPEGCVWGEEGPVEERGDSP